MENIDINTANRIIETAGKNRVPVDDSINSVDLTNGAMDNFDHEENTLSGKIIQLSLSVSWFLVHIANILEQAHSNRGAGLFSLRKTINHTTLGAKKSILRPGN